MAGEERRNRNEKAGEGSGEPSPQIEGNAGMDGREITTWTEEDIARYLTAQQRLERLQKLIEEEKRIAEEFERQKENAKPAILSEIEMKYGLSEKDIEIAFSEISNKNAMISYIINAIEREGEKALEKKEIREKAETIRKIRIAETMNREDIKKIAIFCESARKYLENIDVQEGRDAIHHAGNMSEEAIKLLLFVKEQGGRVSWQEFKRYGKEELGLKTDTLNKRRWGLIDRGYLKKEEESNELILTKAGMARLREEGY